MNNHKNYRTQEPKNRNRKLFNILLGVFCLLVIGAGIFIYAFYGIITNDDASSLLEERSLYKTPKAEIPIATQTAQTPTEDFVLPLPPEPTEFVGITYNGAYFIVHDEAATLQILLDVYYTKVN